jgi:hypothetical protein
MTKDKPVKKEIVYEPISIVTSEFAVIQRMLGEIAKAFRSSDNEGELPVIV